MLKNSNLGNFPCVFHAPALKFHDYNLWKKLCALNYAKKRRFHVPENMCVVTYNTRQFSVLEDCLSYFEVPYQKLEVQNWTNYQKIPLTYDFVSKTSYEYYLCLDASDVFITESPAYILNEFKQKSETILFGSEKKIWPDHWKEAFDDSVPFPYLNSGMWIGQRDAVLKWFGFCQTYNLNSLVLKGDLDRYFTIEGENFSTTDLTTSDQIIHHWCYSELTDKPDLDCCGDMFLNMSYINEDDYEILF